MSTEEQIKKTWYVYMCIYVFICTHTHWNIILAIKAKEILPFITTWIGTLRALCCVKSKTNIYIGYHLYVESKTVELVETEKNGGQL